MPGIKHYPNMPRDVIDRPRHDGGVILDERPITDPKIEIKKPRKFAVVLLNDDFTPMDFVVKILKQYFRHEHERACQIMMEVHQKGQGVAGVYSMEIAETKAMETMQSARSAGHPLQAVLQPVEE